MTADPAIPNRLDDSPADTILSWMQGQTVTQGWDVVCAIAIDKINEWFLQQYVDRLSGGEDAVINGTVPLTGDESIQAVNLTLGPPLISFSPTSSTDSVELTINFLSGQVNHTKNVAGSPVITSVQTVTPGDQYQLHGYVPLASVQGEVENSHDVVIDIRNGASFAAHLGMPEGAETSVGTFMHDWLVNHLDGYKYKLGTLDYKDNGTNLKPAGTFQFGIQIDEKDQTDTGRLLLFIPTTYNPGGGSQPSLGLADVVPKGSSTTLIVSSQVLFANILKDFYEAAFSQEGVKAVASQKGSATTYSLALTEGSISVSSCEYPANAGKAQAKAFTGTFNGYVEKDEPLLIPLAGTQVQVTGNQLHISNTPNWSQDLALQIPTPRGDGIHAHGTATMTANVQCPTTATIPPPANPKDKTPADIIKFQSSPSVSVTFDASNIYNLADFKSYWQDLGNVISATALANLAGLFQVPLPEVNAFAVSNLLFPGLNILDFKSAYVPGDLVVFGDAATPAVEVTPGAATLSQAQTQQFAAATGSGQPVTWSLKSGGPGTISAAGLYTAPSAVTQVEYAHVTATTESANGTAEAAQALVTLVPRGVQVSPSFVLMTPGNAPQQLSAAVAGAASPKVTWSMEPKLGSLNPQGLYTPPSISDLDSPQLVTITASSTADPTIQGSAQIVLLPGVLGMVVEPAQAAPPPGQAQTFAAVGKKKNPTVTWSLLPPVGRITAGGVYIPPETVTAPQAVLVVATNTDDDSLYGCALVTLLPSD